MGRLRSRRGREGGEKSALAVATRKAELAAMVEAAPDLVRQYLTDPKRVETYCAKLMADVSDGECSGHRIAMRTYPELLGMIHSSGDLLAELLKRLGAASEGEVRQAVDLMRDASEDPDEVADKNARPYLAFYYGANGPGSDRPEAAGFRAWLNTVPGSMATVEMPNVEGE